MNLEKAKLTTIVQAIDFEIEICVRYIILEGDLAYAIDKFRSK